MFRITLHSQLVGCNYYTTDQQFFQQTDPSRSIHHSKLRLRRHHTTSRIRQYQPIFISSLPRPHLLPMTLNGTRPTNLNFTLFINTTTIHRPVNRNSFQQKHSISLIRFRRIQTKTRFRTFLPVHTMHHFTLRLRNLSHIRQSSIINMRHRSFFRIFDSGDLTVTISRIVSLTRQVRNISP